MIKGKRILYIVNFSIFYILVSGGVMFVSGIELKSILKIALGVVSLAVIYSLVVIKRHLKRTFD